MARKPVVAPNSRLGALARNDPGVTGEAKAGSVDVLDQLVCDEDGAARLLRAPRSTLHWWLHGGKRGGHLYGLV